MDAKSPNKLTHEELTCLVIAYAEHRRRNDLLALEAALDKIGEPAKSTILNVVEIMADQHTGRLADKAVIASLTKILESSRSVNIDASVRVSAGDGSNIVSGSMLGDKVSLKSSNNSNRPDRSRSAQTSAYSLVLNIIAGAVAFFVIVYTWTTDCGLNTKVLATAAFAGAAAGLLFSKLRWHRLAASGLFGAGGFLHFAFAGAAGGETEAGFLDAKFRFGSGSDVVLVAMLLVGLGVYATGEFFAYRRESRQ